MDNKERTVQSIQIREMLEQEINRLKKLDSDYLREISVEMHVKSAIFKIAQIWLGDIKYKD